MRLGVIVRGNVYPHLTVADGDGEDTHIVGKLVECPVTGQVEASVMPMAGQNPVFECVVLEGKVYVWAVVVYGIHLFAGGEQCQGMPFDLNGQASSSADVSEMGGPNEGLVCFEFHGRFSLLGSNDAIRNGYWLIISYSWVVYLKVAHRGCMNCLLSINQRGASGESGTERP